MTRADEDGNYPGGQIDLGEPANHQRGVERFLVFHTQEYGYSLSPDNDRNITIIPEFLNESVLEEFNRAFSDDSLRMNVGKRIYCDCVIERRNRNGEPSYVVREARLFSQ